MKMYGLSFLSAGIVMLICTLVSWLKIRSFEKNGEDCAATVTDTKTGRMRVNKRNVTTYILVLSYRVNGAEYTSELQVAHSEYVDAVGKRIDIRYNKNNPTKIIAGDMQKSRHSVNILLIITLALFAIGALLFFGI